MLFHQSLSSVSRAPFFTFLLSLSLLFLSLIAYSQKTSSASGDWDTGGNWSGGTAPSAGNWEAINANHTLSRSAGWTVKSTLTVGASGNVTFNGVVTVDGGSNLVVNSGGELEINGNLVHNGSSISFSGDVTINGNATITQTCNVYGNLRITGNLALTGNFRVHPGGSVIVENNVSVTSSQYLVVGTAVAPPPYADMIIKGDLNTFSSGDVLVEQNGRLAVYGDVNGNSGGGTLFTINNGGQVFILGDLNYPGGGDALVNNNTGGNIGLYIDGAVNVASGNVGNSEEEGGYASTNYLRDTEGGGDFYNWITTAEDSPLPVELLSFDIQSENNFCALNWVTASERDNDFFTIEKSFDGIHFTRVATIEGNGTATDQSVYRWEDYNSTNRLVYYRLSQTDFDGTTKIIAMKSVQAGILDVNFSVYPNPVATDRMIRFSGVIPERLTLINQAGQVVFSQNVYSGKFQLPPDMPAGLYLLQGITNGRTSAQRISLK